jgi:hypothetical protein
MKIAINAKDMTVCLNGLREHIRHVNLTDLVKLLKENKIPYAKNLPKFLVDQGILFTKEGHYNWVSQEPVFYKIIEHFLEVQRKIASETARRYFNKKKNIQPTEELSEEECINFLKSKGYRIYKPVVEHVEV